MADPLKKSCGSCTVCCTVTAVPELQKPYLQACKHCVPGKGCGQYGMHPESCRQFMCCWLRDNWPEELRPDRCHVMVETIPGCTTHIALQEPGFKTAWLSDLMQAKFREIKASGKAVVIRPGKGNIQVLAPDGVKAKNVLKQLHKAYRRLK